MDWFLYDNGRRHERVKVEFELSRRQKTSFQSFTQASKCLQCILYEFFILYFFFRSFKVIFFLEA